MALWFAAAAAVCASTGCVATQASATASVASPDFMYRVMQCSPVNCNVCDRAWRQRYSRPARRHLPGLSNGTKRIALPPPGARRRRSTSLLVRSEEHTSELQSLMRISYAVFCLKKKNRHHHTTVPYYNTINSKTSLSVY